MKQIIPALLLVLALSSCDFRRRDKIADDSARVTEQALKDSTTVEIIDSAYNFGSVTEGEKVEYSYRFKNTGSKPLVIITASGSCGCTVPQRPEKPIMPGETGFIKVVFNSAGRVGPNEKHITITSNAKPEFQQLLLKGEVLGKTKQ